MADKATEKKSSSRSEAAKKAAATRKRNAEAARQAVIQEAADRPPGLASVAQMNPEVSRIAREASVKGSSWGSGSEFDKKVRALGHDPAAVRKEIDRLRSENS